MKKTLQFFVLEFEWNSRKVTHVDILPLFRKEWEGREFDRQKVKSVSDLEEWITRIARYYFWSKCEWEFMVGPWPYREDFPGDELQKIDVYFQIKENIPVIAKLLAEEFGVKG